MTILAGSIKLFKYLTFNKTMSQLAGTLTRSAPDLGAFFIMFFIMFTAFAQWAMLIFGAKLEGYSSITQAFYLQTRMVLGDFDFMAMNQAHRVYGPVYFFAYIFLVFFILMVRVTYILPKSTYFLCLFMKDSSNEIYYL